MADVYTDHYWQSKFAITEADVNRLASYIAETDQAHDLTSLARRIVRGRLRHGYETSAPAQPAWTRDTSVRLWDPAGQWQKGDHVVVARMVSKDVYEPFFGEIIMVESHQVRLVLDGVTQPAIYQRAAPDSDKARKWHAKVKEVVAEKQKASNLEERTGAILLKHGDRVASQLLHALRADERFVRLAGRWFLRRMAMLLSEKQLAALAWAMLDLDEPQPTQDLLSLLDPPVTEGDAGLFGLYTGMRDRSDLFANADPGQRPRWVLAGPPPGPAVAGYAAYDPDTHHVLCEPDETLDESTARRLWELDLFRVVSQS
jgi:hypothetical protein